MLSRFGVSRSLILLPVVRNHLMGREMESLVERPEPQRLRFGQLHGLNVASTYRRYVSLIG